MQLQRSRERPRVPFQALSNPSGASPHKSASGSSLQHQHFLQVVTHPLEPEIIVVAHPTDIATSLHPIMALQSADDPLHGPANPRGKFIPPLLLLRYGAITPGPIDDATEHSPASQRLLAGIFGLGAIGKHRGFVADDHPLKQIRLGGSGRNQSQTPQQAAALIHR